MVLVLMVQASPVDGLSSTMSSPLRDYYNRSGDTELGVGWMEENEHGFCVWRREDNRLILVNTYGDGAYWDKWAEDKAREIECDTIYFTTKRSPKSFERKYGYEVTGYILERKV